MLLELIYTYRKGDKPSGIKHTEDSAITDKQLKQAKSQLPQGEKFDRAYSAYEGGIRMISKNAEGREFRYKVIFEADGSVRIEQF